MAPLPCTPNHHSTFPLRHPFLFWYWQRARRTVVRLCLLDTKTGKGATSKVRRIDAVLMPCVDRTGCRVQSPWRWCYCSCPCWSHTRTVEKKVHISVVCMLPFLIGFSESSTYIVSRRPHPALRSRLTPVRADGYSRARWHILWTRPGPHLHALRPHDHPRPAPRPGSHLRAPRPHSRHTKQVAFFIWRSPPNHLPQNALWVLLHGVLQPCRSFSMHASHQ